MNETVYPSAIKIAFCFCTSFSLSFQLMVHNVDITAERRQNREKNWKNNKFMECIRCIVVLKCTSVTTVNTFIFPVLMIMKSHAYTHDIDVRIVTANLICLAFAFQ